MLFKIPENPQEQERFYKEVARLLASDKVGAIPTETFYGLACNPFSQSALERLFNLKDRPPNKPILLLLGRLEDLSLVISRVPPKALKLMKLFWPGPLTIVLPARKSLPKLLTAGLDTIGVRLSSCEVTRKIAQAFRKPITGTSANLTGQPPCKSAEEVLEVFPQIDFVVDGGRSTAQLPSTVVEICDNEIKLIREGLLPFDTILKALEKHK